MSIKPVEEIIKEVKYYFDKDPEGWRVLRGRDSKGHYDTYIAQGTKRLWQMKTEFKTPYRHVGVGALVARNIDEEISRIMDKGSTLPIGEIYPQKDYAIITLGLAKYSPESTVSLKGILSSNQEKLERSLSENLNKLLHREGMLKEYL